MKKTAMQMAIDHYKKLSEQGSNQAYVVAKFLEENFLAMEKEQSLRDYSHGVKDAITDINSVDCNRYYNETYGK